MHTAVAAVCHSFFDEGFSFFPIYAAALMLSTLLERKGTGPTSTRHTISKVTNKYTYGGWKGREPHMIAVIKDLDKLNLVCWFNIRLEPDLADDTTSPTQNRPHNFISQLFPRFCLNP